jgi:hypothetical protein
VTHWLIVDLDGEFDIEHPDSCGRRIFDERSVWERIWEYTCLVGHAISQAGLDMWFELPREPPDHFGRPKFRPVIAEGRHEFHAWQDGEGENWEYGLELGPAPDKTGGAR